MGHSNGQHDKPSTTGKVENVKKVLGLKLTPDNHFHLQNKRLTNISAPMNDHDAVTKKFVADLLKTKAATTYVNNELAKKTNSSALKDYALITDLGTLAIEFNDALKSKVDYNDLETKTQDHNLAANTQKTYPFITVYAEENGPLIKGSLQWSFGNGCERNKQYGWPSPVDGKIVRGSICACAGNRQASEVIVGLVHNGADKDLNIVKPVDEWSKMTIFSDLITIRAGDRINFRSKTSNSAVTHAMVNLLIQIDV